MVKGISHQLSDNWKKSSTIEKVFYIGVVILFIYILNVRSIKNIEHFQQIKEFINKNGEDIYDDFYVNVYDDILFSEFKNEYEIGIIENTSSPTKSILLDIGSGTGHHVGELTKKGYTCQGVDLSTSMVEKSKKNYPTSTFIQGDATKTMTFQPNSFTHITCLYFTLYTIKNKKIFFQNCMHWLMPSGYLILHLVDRDKFDPILPVGDVLASINPQDYAKKRITTTQAAFKNHFYKSNFKLVDNKGIFTETFTNRTDGSVRKHTHELYMESQKHILSLAQNAGFILIETNEMKRVGYNKQYIYTLQKPN